MNPASPIDSLPLSLDAVHSSCLNQSSDSAFIGCDSKGVLSKHKMGWGAWAGSYLGKSVSVPEEGLAPVANLLNKFRQYEKRYAAVAEMMERPPQ